MEGASARIDPQGTPEDPFAVWTSGYLGFERLADEVPDDYVPARSALAHSCVRFSTSPMAR